MTPREAGSWRDLVDALGALDAAAWARLGPAEWASLGRQVARLRPPRAQGALRVALLGNVTLDLLAPVVETVAAREGIAVECRAGGFDQHFQEVLDPESPVAAFAPDLAVLFLALAPFVPGGEAGALDDDGRRRVRDAWLGAVDAWSEAASRALGGALAVANVPSPAHLGLGVADLQEGYGERELHLELATALLRRAKGHPRLRVLDLDRLAAAHGVERLVDPRLRLLARVEWAPAFLPRLAGEIVRHLRAARGLARKALVVDLDGTLWGGVLGEDGVDGVRCGPGDPEGEAFLAVQRRLKSLQRQGVLLAICSRNDPELVAELFARRPEMPLRRRDFAAAAIGWESKHEGIRRLADELSLGLDALVFLDDNPAEVALVRELLPEVHAVLFPEDPAQGVATLDALSDFARSAILAEDRRKTEQYRENAARDALRADAGTLESFLHGLATALTIRPATGADLPRVQQLFAKTNQFNLAGVRYGTGELERLLAADGAEIGVAAVRDRFGDLGTVAAWVLRRAGATLVVENLVVSCRALGRGVETALGNHLAARLVADGEAAALEGRFVPTARNRPAADFYSRQGFARVGGEEDGALRFRLAREAATEVPCPWIEVTCHELARR